MKINKITGLFKGTDGVVSQADKALNTDINTGTDNDKYITSDALAGSNAGSRVIGIQVFDGATAVTTGDGKAYFRIPTTLTGMNLVSCSDQVIVKSTSGLPTIQIARGRQANATSDFTYVDMLSTKLSIDENEYDSKDATTAVVIDTNNDDVVTGDVIRIDIDIAGTGTKGLNISLTFQLP